MFIANFNRKAQKQNRQRKTKHVHDHPTSVRRSNENQRSGWDGFGWSGLDQIGHGIEAFIAQCVWRFVVRRGIMPMTAAVVGDAMFVQGQLWAKRCRERLAWSPVHALYKGLGGRLWAAILAAMSCLSKSRMSCLYFKNYRGSSKMLRLEKDEKRPFQAFYLGHHTAIFTHIIRNGLHPSKNLISVDPFPFLRKAKKYTLFSQV